MRIWICEPNISIMTIGKGAIASDGYVTLTTVNDVGKELEFRFSLELGVCGAICIPDKNIVLPFTSVEVASSDGSPTHGIRLHLSYIDTFLSNNEKYGLLVYDPILIPSGLLTSESACMTPVMVLRPDELAFNTGYYWKNASIACPIISIGRSISGYRLYGYGKEYLIFSVVRKDTPYDIKMNVVVIKRHCGCMISMIMVDVQGKSNLEFDFEPMLIGIRNTMNGMSYAPVGFVFVPDYDQPEYMSTLIHREYLPEKEEK